MSFRAPIRRIALARPALAARGFHSTPRAFVRVGQEIPNLDVLLEDSPGNKVNLAEEFKSANGYIVGVPAAFSGTMKAWSEQLDPAKQTGIRFLGDPTGEFTKALDLGFEAYEVFGGMRGKRYALKVEDGKVSKAYVEPDNTGSAVSMAEQVLD
ncbi:hypothetical protein FoTM2_000637 [Fusarium oxysporum f. sp. vasinfectum]|nr:hypothetical protein FoTM2_000637 [Fusarium oxysporum f. sp. vasinfectum]